MIRAAIIGLGRWGRSQVNAVQGKSGDIQFAAAYTRTRGSAEEFCREKNIPLAASYGKSSPIRTSTPWCWRHRTASTQNR